MFRYVALGDSTAVGVGARRGGYPEHLFQRLRSAGTPVGFLNLGESGATSDDVVPQADRAATKKPHLITVGVGANDSWRGIGPAEFEANLRRIRETLRGTGAQVVVSGLVDISRAPAAAFAENYLKISKAVLESQVLRLDERLRALAEPTWFTVVDLLEFSRTELGSHPEYFSSDGFHPSDAGYARWADLLWPHAQRIAAAWAPRAATDSTST